MGKYTMVKDTKPNWTFAKTPPPPVWRWYIFGKGQAGIHSLVLHVPDQPLYRRLSTRFFFGSVWERI